MKKICGFIFLVIAFVAGHEIGSKREHYSLSLIMLESNMVQMSLLESNNVDSLKRSTRVLLENNYNAYLNRGRVASIFARQLSEENAHRINILLKID